MAAQAQVDRLVALVRARAGTMYRDTVAGRPLSDVAIGSASDFSVRSGYAHAQAKQDSATLTQLQRTEASLDAEQADAARSAHDAAADAASIGAARDALAAANARQMELVAQVQGALAPAVAQVAARQDATDAATARQLYSTPPAPAPTPTAPAAPPSPDGPVAGSHPGMALLAIAFAKAQLGKPYVYAAAGPDSYDCSGLTMAAYAAAGLALPHYSGAQYAMLPHVPLNRLLLGDLIFYGPGGSEHVALYIGDGLMIHAPHTGDVVRVAPVFATPVGAARPW